MPDDFDEIERRFTEKTPKAASSEFDEIESRFSAPTAATATVEAPREPAPIDTTPTIKSATLSDDQAGEDAATGPRFDDPDTQRVYDRMMGRDDAGRSASPLIGIDSRRPDVNAWKAASREKVGRDDPAFDVDPAKRDTVFKAAASAAIAEDRNNRDAAAEAERQRYVEANRDRYNAAGPGAIPAFAIGAEQGVLDYVAGGVRRGFNALSSAYRGTRAPTAEDEQAARDAGTAVEATALGRALDEQREFREGLSIANPTATRAGREAGETVSSLATMGGVGSAAASAAFPEIVGWSAGAGASAASQGASERDTLLASATAAIDYVGMKGAMRLVGPTANALQEWAAKVSARPGGETLVRKTLDALARRVPGVVEGAAGGAGMSARDILANGNLKQAGINIALLTLTHAKRAAGVEATATEAKEAPEARPEVATIPAPVEAPKAAPAPAVEAAPEAFTPTVNASPTRVESPPRVVTPADLPDAKNAAETTWYHGTKAEGITTDSIDTLGSSDPQSLVGMGLYLTDSPTIAESYAKGKGKGGTPTVYEARVNPKAVLNFEEPLPPRVAEKVTAMADGLGEDVGDAVRSAIENGKRGMDVWREFREAMAYSQIPTSEVYEPLQSLQGDLRSLGYDAITHVGGSRAGKGKELHRVLVMLDPQGRGMREPTPNTVTAFAPRKAADPAAAPITPGVYRYAPSSPALFDGAKTPTHVRALRNENGRWIVQPAHGGAEFPVLAEELKPAVDQGSLFPTPKPRSATAIEREGKGKSLSQFVREKGGINANGLNAGEVERLSRKGTGSTGLIRRDGKGLDVEAMMQSARESGYDVPSEMNPGDFAALVERDVTSGDKTFSPETTDFGGLAEAETIRRGKADRERFDSDATPDEKVEYGERGGIETEDLFGGDDSFEPSLFEPSKKPSAIVSREADALAAEKKGQKGFLALGGTKAAGSAAPSPATAKASPSLWERAWDKIRGAKEWVRGNGLDNAFRADPEMAQAMAEGTTIGTFAKSQAALSDMTVKRGLTKPDAIKFDVLSAEHERRSVGKTFRGDPLFDRLFPTEADVQAAFADPKMQEMAKRAKAEFQKHVEPLNIRGGNIDPAQAGKGRPWKPGMGDGEWRDFRTNMAPLTEAEAAASKHSGYGISARSLRGPRVSQSPVGRKFTGEADAYDVSLRSRFERGMSRSGLTAKRLDAIEKGLKNGTIVALDEGDRPEREWVAFKPDVTGDIDIQGRVGANAMPESVRGKTLYITDPKVAAEMRTFFGLDAISRSGLISALSRATTSASVTGLAEASGHALTTLAPVAVRAGRLGGVRAPVDATVFLANEGAAEAERVRQAKYGGSRPVFEKGRVSKYLSPLSKPLEAIDLAVRKSSLDRAEADIKAGRLPDTYKTRRDALLEAGQYNTLAMDPWTRALRAVTGNFLAAGKAAVANAFKFGHQLVGSPGAEMSGGSRSLRMLRTAGILSGYFLLAGSINQKRTGEFAPKGIPFGAVATKRNGDGSWSYTWEYGRPLGVQQFLQLTGAEPAVTDLRQGESAFTAALDAVGAPIMRLERAALEGPMVSAGKTLFEKGDDGVDRLKKTGLRAFPIAHFVYAAFHKAKPGEKDESPIDVLLGLSDDRKGKTLDQMTPRPR